MYSYTWDAETGGLLLNSSPLMFSKEPRPVYYKELDILGFDRFWNYDKNDAYPYMWAEANNYFYRGRLVAKTKGGSLYTPPELICIEDPEPDHAPLRFVDIPAMVEKNQDILEKLSQNTIKKIYNTYVEYKGRVNVFYVAFSGGKDSVVTFDLVQKTLPHNSFKVLFGDTGMEFTDTYAVIDRIASYCLSNKIDFLRAKSKMNTLQTWNLFGPPAVTNRWCCSVHKTSPQVTLLRDYTGIKGFTGMAFTGIRRDESMARSEYEDVCLGGKHNGQFSCHPIIEWNSAELYAYIYQEKLILNETYKKGNSRAGCLVCPMSSGKHEYMKHQCYPHETDSYIERIRTTSGKTGFSDDEMIQFIENGNWKTRKTGRELNFGQDQHMVETVHGKTTITVFRKNKNWQEWAKTIGEFVQLSPNKYTIEYYGKTYELTVDNQQQGIVFSFSNVGSSKEDIKLLSLFRSVIIKSIYCINCGVCMAECTSGCIEMDGSGVHISDNCKHCYQCHDIHEHCLRYNSIRNKIGAERKMKGLDRYYSFGIRKNWLDLYFNDKGTSEFWDTDGHGAVPNKKKDAFLSFLKDADVVSINKAKATDKYSKYEANSFAKLLFNYGTDNELTWALLLCNLSYTSEFNWFIKNISWGGTVTLDSMKNMLKEVMDGDEKDLGKRNICDAFKVILVKTPLGKEIGLGICDYSEKKNASGNETITLNSFYRASWENPDPRVILYSLYKFAEACGDYYQFTLTRLLDHDIDSGGVSPTEIFGLNRETMEKLLTGLSINYPEFINASFTLNLDNITLRADKTSNDVLQLF